MSETKKSQLDEIKRAVSYAAATPHIVCAGWWDELRRVKRKRRLKKFCSYEVVKYLCKEHGMDKVVAGSLDLYAVADLLKGDVESRKQVQAVESKDGKVGPDGFRLDGVLATGLKDNELALLKLALDEQPDGPTEDDVCGLTEFKSWGRERIDKLLGTIKAKFLKAECPRVLRWANRHLVFRKPLQRAKAARKSVEKTNGRKPGETLQKDGRHKRRP